MQEAWRPKAQRSNQFMAQCQEKGWQVLGDGAGGTVTVCVNCTPTSARILGEHGVVARVNGTWMANIYVRPGHNTQTEQAMTDLIQAAQELQPAVVLAGDLNASPNQDRYARVTANCPAIRDAWLNEGAVWHGEPGMVGSTHQWPGGHNRKDYVWLGEAVTAVQVHAWQPYTLTSRSDHGWVAVQLAMPDGQDQPDRVRSPCVIQAARERGRSWLKYKPHHHTRICVKVPTSKQVKWQRWTRQRLGVTRWLTHETWAATFPPATKVTSLPSFAELLTADGGWARERELQQQRYTAEIQQALDSTSTQTCAEALSKLLEPCNTWQPIPPPKPEARLTERQWHLRGLTTIIAAAFAQNTPAAAVPSDWRRHLPRSSTTRRLWQHQTWASDIQAMATAERKGLEELDQKEAAEHRGAIGRRMLARVASQPGKVIARAFKGEASAQYTLAAGNGVTNVTMDCASVQQCWAQTLTEEGWLGTRPHLHSGEWEDPRDAMHIPDHLNWIHQALEPLALSGEASEAMASLLQPLKDKEWAETLARPSTAPGPDGVSRAAIREATPEIQAAARKLCDAILSGTVTPRLMQAEVTLLPKGAAAADMLLQPILPGAARPLRLQSVFMKLVTWVVAQRLANALTEHGLISPASTGFLPKRNAHLPILIRTLYTETAQRKDRTVWSAELDVRKAYDSITPATTAAALRRVGVPTEAITVIQAWSRESHAATHLRTPWGPIPVSLPGLPQGDPLSPILFVLCMEPLLCKLISKSTDMRPSRSMPRLLPTAFADDLALLSTSAVAMREGLQLTEEYVTHAMTARLAQNKCILRLEGGADDSEGVAWPVLGGAQDAIRPTTDSSRHLGVPRHSGNAQAQTQAQENDVLGKLETIRGALMDDLLPLELRAWLWRVVAAPRLAWILASHTRLSPTFLRKQMSGWCKAMVGLHWVNRQRIPTDNLVAPQDGVIPGMGITSLEHIATAAIVHRLVMAQACLHTCESAAAKPGNGREGWGEACRAIHSMIRDCVAATTADMGSWGRSLAEALSATGTQVRLWSTLEEQLADTPSTPAAGTTPVALQPGTAVILQPRETGVTAVWNGGAITLTWPRRPGSQAPSRSLPMLTAQERELRLVQAAKAWAEQEGAGLVVVAGRLAAGTVRLAAQGDQAAMQLVRLENECWGTQADTYTTLKYSTSLWPEGRHIQEADEHGVTASAVHRTLRARLQVRATAAALLHAPGLPMLRFPGGRPDSTDIRRPQRLAREAPLVEVREALHESSLAADMQPRLCSLMLRTGSWQLRQAAHSAVLRGASRVPALQLAGHHHAPHHYSPSCRICAASGDTHPPIDDMQHALKCPATEPDNPVQRPLAEEALVITAKHFLWQGQLAPARPTGSAGSRWVCPPWLQPVWQLGDQETEEPELAWAAATRCKAMLAAAPAACVLASKSGSSMHHQVAWAAAAAAGTPMPRDGPCAGWQHRQLHLPGTLWLQAVCGWLKLDRAQVGNAVVWAAGSEALDAPPWQALQQHSQTVASVYRPGTLLVWWPATVLDCALALPRTATATAWLVPGPHGTRAEGWQRTAKAAGSLVTRASPPDNWPLPWRPSPEELGQQLQLAADQGWELWWRPEVASQAAERLARAARHQHSDQVLSQEERTRQLAVLARLDPRGMAGLAMGRWPRALDQALACAQAQPTQAAITAWGAEYHVQAARYWAARQAQLRELESQRWGCAGWLPGSSQLRDLALASPTLWRQPALALDATPEPVHTMVKHLAQQVQGFDPWPMTLTRDWWGSLAALPACHNVRLGWLWLTPIAMSAKAAPHACWALTRILATSPGPLVSNDTARRNPLAWLATWPEHARSAAALQRWRNRAGIIPQHQWWRRVAVHWGAMSELVAALPDEEDDDNNVRDSNSAEQSAWDLLYG